MRFFEVWLPTSYEDGYHLFVSLTCVVGFLFALFLAFGTRKASTRIVFEAYGFPLRDSKITGFVCVFFSALCVAASSAVLAWGIAVSPPFAGYMLAPIIVGGGLLLCLCVCSCSRGGLPSEELDQLDHTPVCLASLVNLQTIFTLFLLIPGLILLAMYCKQMADTQKYEYHGPVRITGYQVDFFSKEFCRTDTYCFGYHGKLQVAFGMSWGCPLYPENWCSGTVLDPDCTIYVCEDGYHSGSTYGCRRAECDCDAGRDEAESCIMKKYDLYQWSDKVKFDDPEYDRDMKPQEDPNWPSVSLYGDCSTCAATMQVPEERALELKSVGTRMAIAGASGYAIILLIGLAKLLRSRSGGRLVQNGKPEQGSCSKS